MLVLTARLFAHLALAMLAGPASAGETRVAVAANFTAAAEAIARAFAEQGGGDVALSFGSTGQLYAQITQGAPFAAFLAADQATPARAVAAGFAVPDSRFTYAVGAVILYSAEARMALDAGTLRAGAFERLAIANPATAPYGVAALEVIDHLGLSEALAPKLVRGNSIAQTYQFVASGAAELGFVARAQIAGHDRGARWTPPPGSHAPIRQDAALIDAEDETARAFLAFLRQPAARAIIARHGYEAP